MGSNQAAVLYTSLTRDGALAEICFHWGQLTPLPSKPVQLHTLEVAVVKTLRLLRAQLPDLGMDADRMDPGYARSQALGAAVLFLGHDGFIVPSARWDCDHLILFNDRQADFRCLQLVSTEEILDWQSWGRTRQLIT
jgi:hypothetical protein